MWLRHKSSKALPETWWEESAPLQPTASLQHKLQKLKAHLKERNKETFGNVFQKKEELLQSIKELDEKESAVILSEQNRKQRDEAKQEFQEAAIQEEITWPQNLGLVGFEMATTILSALTPVLIAEKP